MWPISAVRFSRLSQSRFGEPTAPAIRSDLTDRDWRHNPSRPASAQIPTKHPSNWPQPPLTLRDATPHITPVGLTQTEASRQIIEALRDIRVAQVMYNPALLKTVAPDVVAKFNAMAKLAKKHPLSPLELSKDPLAMASTSAALAERLSQMAKDPAHKTNKGLFELGSLALVDSTRTYLAIAAENRQYYSKSVVFAGDDPQPKKNPITAITGLIGSSINWVSGNLANFVIHYVGRPTLLEKREDRDYYSKTIAYITGALAGAVSASWIVTTPALCPGLDSFDGLPLTLLTAASTQIQGKYIYGVGGKKELYQMSKLAIQKGTELGVPLLTANGLGAEFAISFLMDASLRPALASILHYSNNIAWKVAFESAIEAKRPIDVKDERFQKLYGKYYADAVEKGRTAILRYPKAILDWFRGKHDQTSVKTHEYLVEAEEKIQDLGLSSTVEAMNMATNDILTDGTFTTMGNYAEVSVFNMMGMRANKRTPLDIYRDNLRDYSDWLGNRTRRYLSDVHVEYSDPEYSNLMHELA